MQAAHARLTQAGAELGIDFRWSIMRRANTFDAHRLLAWALRTEGAPTQRALKKAILRAYFTEGADVDRPRRCSPTWPPRSGSTASRPRRCSPPTPRPPRCARRRPLAHREGIAAVPTFVVEGRWMLQGALETEKWVRALTRLSEELAAESPTARDTPAFL